MLQASREIAFLIREKRVIQFQDRDVDPQPRRGVPLVGPGAEAQEPPAVFRAQVDVLARAVGDQPPVEQDLAVFVEDVPHVRREGQPVARGQAEGPEAQARGGPGDAHVQTLGNTRRSGGAGVEPVLRGQRVEFQLRAAEIHPRRGDVEPRGRLIQGAEVDAVPFASLQRGGVVAVQLNEGHAGVAGLGAVEVFERGPDAQVPRENRKRIEMLGQAHHGRRVNIDVVVQGGGEHVVDKADAAAGLTEEAGAPEKPTDHGPRKVAQVRRAEAEGGAQGHEIAVDLVDERGLAGGKEGVEVFKVVFVVVDEVDDLRHVVAHGDGDVEQGERRSGALHEARRVVEKYVLVVGHGREGVAHAEGTCPADRQGAFRGRQRSGQGQGGYRKEKSFHGRSPQSAGIWSGRVGNTTSK